MPKVSVIIPTSRQGKEYLEVCLPSLRNQTYEDFEVIIVDDASTDQTLPFLKKNFPEFKVIHSSVNIGFCKAINLGIQASKGQYVAFLNNDTEADENWLQELVKAFETNNDVYFCASKMLNYYNRTLIDSAGDGWTWQHFGGYNIGRNKKDGPEFSKPKYVFAACGGASIYRRELFEKIGLLDEEMFAYFEDIDIAFRAQLAGLKCLYVPTAVVYHMWGGTFGRVSSRDYLISRNQLIVIFKNFPKELLLKHRKKIFSVFFGPIKQFFKHPRSYYPAVLARLQLLIWLPRIIRERKRVQSYRKISIEELEKILS